MVDLAAVPNPAGTPTTADGFLDEAEAHMRHADRFAADGKAEMARIHAEAAAASGIIASAKMLRDLRDALTMMQHTATHPLHSEQPTQHGTGHHGE